MSVYTLTPLARADIFDIWSFIAEHSEDAADRVERAIYEGCEFIAEGPLRGHSHPGVTVRGLRFWTLTRYPHYIVVYRPETKPLQIVAVLHGKRNIWRILKQHPWFSRCHAVIAIALSGLPEPFTIFSGAAITTAPVAGN